MELAKNSAIIIIGMFLSNLLAYVFHFYAGRSLGPAEYGVFGALLSLFLIIALPAGAIGNAITKYAAKYNSKKEYGKIGRLRREVVKKAWIYSILLFLVICLLSGFIANYLKINSVIPVIFVGFNLIFAMILPVNRGVLQGMKKFKIYSINTILEAFSRLVLVVILLFFGMGVDGTILAYGLGYFIAFLLIFPFIKETRDSSLDKIEMKPIYRYIIIILIIGFILQSIINLPAIFIKHFLSSELTGYWTAALTISRIALFGAGGVGLVMFSEVAGQEDKKERKKIFRKALVLTLLAAAGIGLIIMLFPEIIINILYGADFAGAVPILRLLPLAMIGLSVLQLYISYWLAGYRD